MSSEYRCRGLRIWCGHRCEVQSATAPAGYPLHGFFCPLHRYQEPKVGVDGSVKFYMYLSADPVTGKLEKRPVIEEHIRRRTSFVGPESSLAAEMLKAPGVSRDGKTATQEAILSWLKQKRGCDQAAAVAYASRMVELGLLLKKDGSHATSLSPQSLAVYRIVTTAPPLPGGGGCSGV